MELSQLKRFLIGRPLASEHAAEEKISKVKALAVIASDSLSSVAYATEEILIPLALFSVVASAWSMPIALGIALLILILTFSYRQTIDAYPNGGGAYTVASENIGPNAGLIAGAALLVDYVLTVAVSVSAGVENLASAFPIVGAHKIIFCTIVILVIMTLNLRGVRESATYFAAPTYFFILTILITVGYGFYRGVEDPSLASHPIIHESYPAVPLLLLMRAFSSGCAALTGIEAMTNGLTIFREPRQRNAKITMIWMSVILGGLFLGITLLAHRVGVMPIPGQTVVSQLSRAVFGDSFFYYAVQFSTALILFLAANTAYTGFPRLSSLLARDRYLPRQLASIGDRLVFSNGILGLSVFAILLIIVFEGTTHYLIPLYAVGVFLSFSLSQIGMIIHHYRIRKADWRKSIVINCIGAIATTTVLLIITYTKFLEGAWMVVLLIPAMVFVFKQIQDHYRSLQDQLSYPADFVPQPLKRQQHTVVVPVSGVHPGVISTLEYALSISTDVRAVYVEIEPELTERMKKTWSKMVIGVELTILPSPYRSIIRPVLDYISSVQKATQDDLLTVLIPEFVTKYWYHQFLHNQTALLLRAAIRLKRGRVVSSVRYYLK